MIFTDFLFGFLNQTQFQKPQNSNIYILSKGETLCILSLDGKCLIFRYCVLLLLRVRSQQLESALSRKGLCNVLQILL